MYTFSGVTASKGIVIGPVEQIDHVVDAVEPVLAALLTVSVGATLVAVMLPLVGMLGAIG